MVVRSRVLAPEHLRALWEGEPQPADVVMTFRYAVYLQTGSGHPLAICTRDAVRLPFAAVLPEHSITAPLPQHGPAHIGGGVLRIGMTEYVPGRWHTPPIRRARPTSTAVTRFVRLAGDCEPDLDLPPAVLRRLQDRRYAVNPAELIGRGSGLTPTGDDILYGYLCGLTALGVAAGDLDEAITRLLPRTTWLSGALLRSAIHGHIGDDVALLLLAADRSPAAWQHAATLARSRGHTSGPALAYGAAAAVLRIYADMSAKEPMSA